MTKPPITATKHVLPFSSLSPVDFERLCLWLVEREGFERAQHLGLAGSEQGRDVVAYRPGPGGAELWYFQCKRYQSIRAQALRDEVDKCVALYEAQAELKPRGLVFVLSCAVAARAREKVANHCANQGLLCEFWAVTELDERVKRHPDVLREFFHLDAEGVEWPGVALFTVPFPRNERFVGREAELAELHRLLGERQGAIGITPAGISGMGGIGKTQLAVEYAYRTHDAYPGGVFWINAAHLEEWAPQLVNLADRLRLAAADPTSPDRTGQMVAALAHYLHSYPGSLVIFDNVADPADLKAVRLGAGLTPVQLGGALLFTTRRREMPTGLAALDVPVLPRESSRQMLLAARPGAADDPNLDRLCDALGDLPLALNLAAAALRNRPGLSLAAYLEYLPQLGADQVHEKAHVTLADYYAASLTPALQAQWEMLADENARLLLRVAGQLAEAELIPVARLGLLAGLRDDQDGLDEPLRDALRSLLAGCLVEAMEPGAEERVRLHPLVREFAARRTPVEETPAFRCRCAANLAGAYEEMARLEEECAGRGVDAAEADLAAALELPAGDGAEADGRREVEERLRGLLRVMQRECHVLRGWDRAAAPGLLAQRVQYRAAALGLGEVAARAAARLEALGGPWLALCWRAGPETAGLERMLAGHSGGVNAVAIIKPDERRAISGSDDGTLKVWDLATGREERTLVGHSREVLAVATLGPDGRRAISGSDDGTLKVWDLATGREERTLQGHSYGVTAVAAIGPDGRRAISGSIDGTLKVWDLATGREERTLEGHSRGVNSVAVIGPDGRRAISGSSDGTLKVWDLATGQEERTLAGHIGPVTAVAALGPDGRLAVSGSLDGTLKVWDVATGREDRTLVGHSRGVTAVAAIGPDGRQAISGSADGTLKVWNLAAGREERTVKGHSHWVRAVAAIGPDGQRAISGSWDGTLKVWDLATRREGRMLEGHSDWVNAVAALGPDGRRAISGSADRTLKVWDLATGREERTLEGHSRGVTAVAAIGPDGRQAISGSDDKTLKVWDLATGREERMLVGHSESVTAVAALGPDGRRAISGSDDGTLKVWDVATGREERTLEGHSEWVTAVAAFGPDGRRAISGSRDGTLKVWDLATGREERTLEGHSEWVTAVAAFGPDGRRAISGSRDGTLKVWDLATGREERTLEGHTKAVFAVAALGPDWRRAVSGSDDKTLKVWNLATGREMVSLAVEAAVYCVAAGPGGTIVAGDSVGNVDCLELRGCQPISGTE